MGASHCSYSPVISGSVVHHFRFVGGIPISAGEIRIVLHFCWWNPTFPVVSLLFCLFCQSFPPFFSILQAPQLSTFSGPWRFGRYPRHTGAAIVGAAKAAGDAHAEVDQVLEPEPAKGDNGGRWMKHDMSTSYQLLWMILTYIYYIILYYIILYYIIYMNMIMGWSIGDQLLDGWLTN